jgi:5-oxoprolinase (ATP-hydrolysing) subunit A
MSQSPRVDLNADVGESFGARHIGDDEPIFRYVTSANVACGFHAGDTNIIAATIRAAAARKVAVGAHPSYPDSAGFGRQTIDMPTDELRNVIIYQIGAVDALARSLGVTLVHVKPHGALYNDAAKNPALAAGVADAVVTYDKNLILVGLAGSHLVAAGQAAGLRVAAEAFCDRVYEADGFLRSRAHPDALIEDPKRAAAQAVDIVVHQRVIASQGKAIRVQAQTLCVHGDTPNAVDVASAIRKALGNAGVEIAEMQRLL